MERETDGWRKRWMSGEEVDEWSERWMSGKRGG